MVVLGVQAGTSASAATDAATNRTAGATALPLSASARATALKDAQADAAATAGRLNLSDGEKLVARDVIKDADGTTHTRYERTYDGLPVLGGDLVVHTAKDGSLKGSTKARKGSVGVGSTDAGITVSAAKKSAVASDKTIKGAAADSTRKVVWAADPSKAPALAYESVVTGTQKDGTPSELHVVTDAATGKQLYSYQAIETGTGVSEYSGTVTLGTTASASGGYDLTDGGRGGHKTYDLNGGTSGTGTLFHDADDTWGDGTVANRQTAGVDAAYGAAQTWDFYKDAFNRNGIAGDGKAAYSRVHYGTAYVNAFWSDSCFCMTYGDGIGNVHPLTALDVAGHEMSHGLTASTAGLKYSRESGGLNEATSDIFGTAVEFHANNSSDVGDYLIGEKIDINGDGTPLRYMDKPSKDGSSADYWSRTTARLDVHYSSGVANHFFYLLSEGSGAKTINGVSYNSPTYNGSSVAGIGRDKAEQIWYKALTTYMTSSTDYAGARTATLSAAKDLYGASSAESAAVAAAWTAVNVN
ncbi:M4 family metallopeptidase [Streptomyces sp. VRA16 Mangrove soil]|uniref:M4 family metallopeptidase n=1 Tax=Streptomyces sp. VRA16 Mangrove soil TaxID=2817434 RepID=UPI001A9CCABA|nr:M4 family metallopeptidase [Streptomyces sp. VRA16 Mangrove soil]MBO1337917.1 M4 family metallopeptidase [Streptomyces sp. VRA16 Mangrove soil]